MKKWVLMFIVAVMSLSGGMAQELPPEATARAFYEALLNSPPDAYAEVASFICSDILYTEREYRTLAAARSGAPVDTSGLTFTAEVINESEAVVTISGSVSTSLLVELPTEPIRMVKEGTWKICPPRPPAIVISLDDLALTEESAYDVAYNFYNAFYTGDTETLQNLVCAEKQPDLIQIAQENSRYTLAENNDWGISSLQAEGYTLKVSTSGVLRVNRDDGAVVALQERADFPTPVLIRENGWKFCGGYREGERGAVNFLLGFYRYRTEELDRYTCREYKMLIREPAEAWSSRDVADVRVPPEFFVPSPENLDEASVLNLEQVIILFGDGQVASAADIFGPAARMVYEDNRWKWCQLTEVQLIEMQATEEAN